MDFFLFLLVNAALFIRPAELIPATYGWPIYEVVIIANLLVAGPAIVNQLAERTLYRTPVTVCILGVFAFVILSHLAQLDLAGAGDSAIHIGKIILYFLLLVATVNTPTRLLTLLAAVVVFTLIVNAIAVLHYHGIIELPTLRVLMEGDFNPLTGEGSGVARLGGTGIFGDPNDLSMIIVACLLICAAGIFYRRLGPLRVALVAPVGFLFYCLTLTQSRGGLLAFLAGSGVLAWSWLGPVRAGLIGVAGFPVLLMGFSSRQADISGALSGGTGRSRVELWSMGLQMLKTSPLFGIGHGRYAEEATQVAHNSFINAFGELGFLGGMLFLGIFVVAGWSLWSLRPVRHEIEHPGLRHVHPFLLAMLAAYCVSMLSLSRCFEIPTFFMAGVAVCYDRLARPDTSLRPLTFNGQLLRWIALASVGFIACVYLYIKIGFR